jgi:hypothetical protein
MDLLSAILTCSLYLADDGLVRAIAESTSESNPYFVMDASVDLTQVDPTPRAKSTSEAATRATDILAKGGRPLLGLLRVPPAWMDAFGRDLAAAFDPCTNLAVGTAMLSQFDVECSGRGDKTRAHSHAITAMRGVPSAAHRQCVLHKYEDAIGDPDFALTTTLELRYQRLAHPRVEAAPIFAPAPSAHWGPDQLLVSASFLPLAASDPSDP